MSVRVTNLSYSIKNKTILSDISFTLERGRITLFVGKSGSGKTTILRSLVGLSNPMKGDILLDGEPPAFVFQQPELFSHMSVYENCIHPQVIVKHRSREEAEEKANSLLRLLDIDTIADHYPHELSGGQRQRVAIVRSLCMDKKTLLFDEPTSALDPFSTSLFRQLLESLKDQDLTLAISTHDLPLIQECLDRAYLIDQGKIISSYDKNTDQLDESHLLYQYLNTQR